MKRFAHAYCGALLSVTIWLALPQAALHAQKTLSEGIKDLATQIATNSAKEQKQKIAVLPFRELDGQATVLGTYISEELVTNLFMIGGLEIVERTMLDKLIGEIKLGQTGVIDPGTAKQVGKIAGVDAIVTGTITDLQSYVALNCRLIDTQTGRIFSAAQTKIVKDDDVKKIIGAPLAASSTPPGGTQGRSSGSAKPQKADAKPNQQQQVNGFLFELKSCTMHSGSVECDFLITNNREDRRFEFYSRGEPSRLIDANGTEYLAAQGIYRERSMRESSRSDMVSGIPMRAKLVFENVPSDVELARLVEVSCWSGSNLRVQFRNVPLVRP